MPSDFDSETTPTPREPADTLRTLDAAANRAREGLRVVEDFVRFTLDDAHLTELLKNCRHAITQALARIEPLALLKARDTGRDVGAGISNASERSRQSPADVAHANFKRVEEALRTLEEFGKIVLADMAAEIEQVRYQLYTLEKAVFVAAAGRRRFEGRELYLLLTESACRQNVFHVAREAMAGGVGVVQLREKSMDDRSLLAHARQLRALTREAGALVIINDRPDMAVVADADGVHVGQDEMPVREARRIVGPDRLVGVSTHSIEQARQAVLDGADYLGVGPVFASGTKRFDRLAGLDVVRQAAAEISLPWFAIGGITLENVEHVVAAGARRIAVSAAICGADSPREVAEQLTQVFRAKSD